MEPKEQPLHVEPKQAMNTVTESSDTHNAIRHLRAGEQVQLSYDCSEQSLLHCTTGYWEILAYCEASPESPKPNEDSLGISIITPDHCVLAVADGVGGLKNGHLASSSCIKHLNEALSNYCARQTFSEIQDSPRAAILNSIDQIHHQIQNELAGAASTIAVVELQEQNLRSYHVGDSSVLVCGNRGKLVFRTIDHSPTGYGVEAGLLDKKESLHHAERHLLLNALGLEEMRYEVSSAQPLALRDTVVVATDGLFDNLYLQEIIDIVRKGPLDSAMDRLVSLSKHRMNAGNNGKPSKPDDRAIILARRVPQPAK